MILFLVPLLTSAIPSKNPSIRQKNFQENKQTGLLQLSNLVQGSFPSKSKFQFCTHILQRAEICLKRFSSAILSSNYGNFLNNRIINETASNLIGVFYKKL